MKACYVLHEADSLFMALHHTFDVALRVGNGS